MTLQTGDWEKAIGPAGTQAKVDNANPLVLLDKEGSDLCPGDRTAFPAEIRHSGAGAAERLALHGRRLSSSLFILASDSIFTTTVEFEVVEPYQFERRARRMTIGGSDMV